jgi:hypothetical protein
MRNDDDGFVRRDLLVARCELQKQVQCHVIRRAAEVALGEGRSSGSANDCPRAVRDQAVLSLALAAQSELEAVSGAG